MKAVLLALPRLFPSDFHDQFGDAMREHLERDYEVARSRGPAPLAAFVVATMWDLGASAVLEHISPTLTPAHNAVRGDDMQSMLQQWWSDLKLAGRALRRAPGFSVVAVGTLGLAIGATAAMFSVVNSVLLNPLPFAAADRLVSVSSLAPGSQVQGEFGVSPEFLIQFKEQAKTLEDAAVFNTGTSTLRVRDRVERVSMGFASSGVFAVLGGRPLLGRLPVATDDGVVVISYKMWTDWLGQDSSVIGQSHFVSDRDRQIIGVMPPEFRFPSDGVLLWIPFEVSPTGTPGRFFYEMVARKKPGVSDEAVVTELTALSKRLPERFGGSANYLRIMERYQSKLTPLTERLFGNVKQPLWVLLGAAGIVLIIACANVANLFLVRTEGRHRELAVRRAVGAGRGQLIRLQMSESFAIAALAGVVAVVLAWFSLPALLRAAPQGVPRLSDVSVDGATLGFTFLMAVASALACGLVPAMRASSPDLSRLRDGGRGATGRRRWGRDGLVVAQTALALVLLIGSGLLMRSYDKLNRVDAGYDTKDIFTFQIAPRQAQLVDGPAWARFHMDFMSRLRALPGTQLVGLVENVPLDEGTTNVRFVSDEMDEGADAGIRMSYTFTAGDYFKVMGIDVLAGRPFSDDDQLSMAPQVVISRSVAETLWPGKSAVGRRMRQDLLAGPDSIAERWTTVIGVVEDVIQSNFRDKPLPLVYYPMVGATPTAVALGSPAYTMKTPRADIVANEIRAIVKEVAPEAPMYRAYTMEFLANRSMLQLSFMMMTLGIVSMLALILGAVGLYGVLSYIVAERTREIGVRMALGAEASRVLRMVVGQGARVVAVGIVIGVVVSYWASKALGSLLFGVDALDPTTFIGMSAAMVLVGMLASYMPARRASAVDPVESLRGD